MAYPDDILEHYKALETPNDSLHREVCNVISSYNNPWDPLAELIQNAVDAVNTRAHQEDQGFKGRVRIVIDKTSSTILVEDNGTGIPPQHMQDVLVPGGSLKVSGKTYGHKGHGFTYCAHISSLAQVSTFDLHTQSTDHWALQGAFQWVKDPTSSPSIDKRDPEIRTFEGPGTSVKLTLDVGTFEAVSANTSVLENFFDWADDPKLLEFVLRTRTAIGHVGTLFGESPVTEIDVRAECINSNANTAIPFQYFDLEKLAPMSASTYPEARDYFNKVYRVAAATDKTHHGIHFVFATDETKSHSNVLKVGKHKGGVEFKAYVYALGKENLASALASYDSRLGRGGEFRYLAIDSGAYLAIAGMPCGNPIDYWSNFGGFHDRFFAMVDAELKFGTALDSGRKTISPYYATLFVDKLDSLIREKHYFDGQANLYELATQLNVRHKGGPPGQGFPATYIAQWEAGPPCESNALALRYQPRDELATYLIMGELIGRGLLMGYELRYVSSSAIYDAAISLSIDLSCPMATNSTVDGGINPVGIGALIVNQMKPDSGYPVFTWRQPIDGRDYMVAEFKLQASSLLTEVYKKRSPKELGHIDVLVCWETDQQALTQKGASITPVQLAARKIPGHTHTLTASGQQVDVISLSQVIRDLRQEEML